ncbi:MAG TPA: hypothetical protein VLJ60_12290 [bacterium]|nr:hypothetical protein [bacterium]
MKRFREELVSKTLDFLWDRWSELGVLGQVQKQDERIIDPEALILFSFTVARFDARLFDEIFDWIRFNGQFLNMQRFQNLIKTYGFEGAPVLSAVAMTQQESGSYGLKWKKIASAYKKTQIEPLFYLVSGDALPVPEIQDDNFKKCGFYRGEINLRGKSQNFPKNGFSSLILRLRGLFGVNIRCELLALIAAVEEIYASEAARQTCFYQKSVQQALSEMFNSGALKSVSTGKIKKYRLTPGVLDGLLKIDGKSPKWFAWAPAFRVLEMIIQKLYDKKLNESSQLLFSSEMRQLMFAIIPLLESAGLGNLVSDPNQHLGEKYTQVFFSDISKILAVVTGS